MDVGIDLDRPVALHPLVYLAEGDEVTVGRPDVDAYAVFPADGAELLRRLESGVTPRQAAGWYRSTYGQEVDVEDLIAGLDEMGFIRSGEEPVADATPVRWQRLGRALFSTPAWIGYGLLAGASIVAMVRTPALAPHYRNLFFTNYYSVIELALFAGQIPLLLVHEGFHALAGRRLGLRSSLSIGHRLYFIVFETSLDGLVAVPRRRRYLPILAGMLADALAIAALTLAAAALRHPDGTMPYAGRLCLAIAYTTLLRLIWQFYFYLRTDLYVLFSLALGCVDLQPAVRGVLRNAWLRLRGRPAADLSATHPNDLRVARWYAWLSLAGYAFTLATFLIAVVPTMLRFLVGVLGRFVTGAHVTGLVDSGVFVGLNAAQIAVIVALTIRDRRRTIPDPQPAVR